MLLSLSMSCPQCLPQPEAQLHIHLISESCFLEITFSPASSRLVLPQDSIPLSCHPPVASITHASIWTYSHTKPAGDCLPQQRAGCIFPRMHWGLFKHSQNWMFNFLRTPSNLYTFPSILSLHLSCCYFASVLLSPSPLVFSDTFLLSLIYLGVIMASSTDTEKGTREGSRENGKEAKTLTSACQITTFRRLKFCHHFTQPGIVPNLYQFQQNKKKLFV